MGRRAELSSGTGWTGDKLGSSVKRCYLKRALGFIQAQERGPGGWDGLALPGVGGRRAGSPGGRGRPAVLGWGRAWGTGQGGAERALQGAAPPRTDWGSKHRDSAGTRLGAQAEGTGVTV